MSATASVFADVRPWHSSDDIAVTSGSWVGVPATIALFNYRRAQRTRETTGAANVELDIILNALTAIDCWQASHAATNLDDTDYQISWQWDDVTPWVAEAYGSTQRVDPSGATASTYIYGHGLGHVAGAVEWSDPNHIYGVDPNNFAVAQNGPTSVTMRRARVLLSVAQTTRGYHEIGPAFLGVNSWQLIAPPSGSAKAGAEPMRGFEEITSGDDVFWRISPSWVVVGHQAAKLAKWAREKKQAQAPCFVFPVPAMPGANVATDTQATTRGTALAPWMRGGVVAIRKVVVEPMGSDVDLRRVKLVCEQWHERAYE